MAAVDAAALDQRLFYRSPSFAGGTGGGGGLLLLTLSLRTAGVKNS